MITEKEKEYLFLMNLRFYEFWKKEHEYFKNTKYGDDSLIKMNFFKNLIEVLK